MSVEGVKIGKKKLENEGKQVFPPFVVMERCQESLLISRFSKNRWDLERYRYPLEFGTNCEFLAQRV